MLRITLIPTPKVQILLTAVYIRKNDTQITSEEPEVDEAIREFEKQFPDQQNEDGTGECTQREQVIRFSRMFMNFLNFAGIDSSAHEFLFFEDRFVVTMTVDTEDAEKIDQWYTNLSKFSPDP